jgi:hypothetical protein
MPERAKVEHESQRGPPREQDILHRPCRVMFYCQRRRAHVGRFQEEICEDGLPTAGILVDPWDPGHPM